MIWRAMNELTISMAYTSGLSVMYDAEAWDSTYPNSKSCEKGELKGVWVLVVGESEKWVYV